MKKLLIGVVVLFFSFGLIGCKNEDYHFGLFYTVQEAYDNGWLMKEDLQSISNYLNDEPMLVYPEALGAEIEEDIKETRVYHLRAETYSDGTSKQPEATVNDVTVIGYYGKYNDCFAVMLQDSYYDYSEAEWSVNIAGVVFNYSNGNSILIWREDKMNVRLKQGIYTTDDGISHVSLYGDNEFVFNRHITTSYLPTGNYSIVNGRLFLNSNGNEEFIFEIKDDCLVFISGDLPDGMIQPGTIFRLSSNDPQVLTQGMYLTEDGLSSITLHGDNEFIFNRHIGTSYRPTGKYMILNNILTLNSENDVMFIFHIDNRQLVFISGQLAEPLIPSGTIFKLNT